MCKILRVSACVCLIVACIPGHPRRQKMTRSLSASGVQRVSCLLWWDEGHHLRTNLTSPSSGAPLSRLRHGRDHGPNCQSLRIHPGMASRHFERAHNICRLILTRRTCLERASWALQVCEWFMCVFCSQSQRVLAGCAGAKRVMLCRVMLRTRTSRQDTRAGLALWFL